MHYHSFLFSVMCKCSYLNEDHLKNRKNKSVLPSSDSSSQVTTPTNRKSSRSSSTSQRKISATFFSSPRSPRRQSQALEDRSPTAWIAKDEAARSGGTIPKLFLPHQLKRGKLKRRVTIGSILSASSGSGDAEEPDWPPFADEDYIVFCFEEDGAFHVKEDGSKLQCEENGNLSSECRDVNKDVNHLRLINRRDCLLPNKELLQAEGDMSSSQMSPKLRKDGIDFGKHLLANSKIMLGNELSESMECRNGSVESESTDSSQLYNEEQFQNEHDSEVEQSSFAWNLISQDGIVDDNALPDLRRACVLPDTDVHEQEMILSPKSKLGVMIRIDDLLKGHTDVSSIESDQSSGFSGSDSRDDEDEQHEENQELASESAKSSTSNQSNISSNSFEFPVLELAWVGSPVVTWPRSSGRVHFRKQKSRPACLRCCKF